MSETALTNPTTNVSLDFAEYVRQREAELSRHWVSGAPDYAFSLDARMRSQLASSSLLRTLGQALNAATVPYQRQIYLMNGIAVGPRQFPEIHALGEDCARALGIGIPQLFVIQDAVPNAWTYATGDVGQIIVLTSSLVQACALPELKFIIGHECGHIHNQHVVYNTVWELIANPLAQGVLLAAVKLVPGIGAVFPLLQMATKAALWYVVGRWHRCAEFTCDRAGLICVGDAETAFQALGKLESGGAHLLQGFNPDAYTQQLQQINQSPLRFMEIWQEHPLGPKRVEALRLFAQSEVFYSWRPALRGGEQVRRQTSVDAACESLVQ